MWLEGTQERLISHPFALTVRGVANCRILCRWLWLWWIMVGRGDEGRGGAGDMRMHMQRYHICRRGNVQYTDGYELCNAGQRQRGGKGVIGMGLRDEDEDEDVMWRMFNAIVGRIGRKLPAFHAPILSHFYYHLVYRAQPSPPPISLQLLHPFKHTLSRSTAGTYTPSPRDPPPGRHRPSRSQTRTIPHPARSPRV